ncbi:unnamed protein product [Prorocentrum cordatum]|uniref:Glycosyl transferase CAP10 domain-containing protein n=1 Tax=Prorocentrum cordatum TaxID=2364126 RepID=A0ABN9XIT8_9DINO|nr:unnamed protein product [Polarella glacialis]
MQPRERSKSRDPWNKGDKDTVNQLVAKIAPATPEVTRSEAFKHVYVKAPPAEQKEAVNKHRKDIKENIRKIGIIIKAVAAADRPANDADCKDIAVLKCMLTESSGSENQLSEVNIQLEKEQGHLREIQQKEAEVRERRIQIEETIRNIQETTDQLTKSKDEGGTAESADTEMHNAEEGVGRAPGNPHAGLGSEAPASSAAPKAAAASHAAPAVPESSREMGSIKGCLQRLTAAQMQQQNQQEAMMRQIGSFRGHLMDEVRMMMKAAPWTAQGPRMPQQEPGMGSQPTPTTPMQAGQVPGISPTSTAASTPPGYPNIYEQLRAERHAAGMVFRRAPSPADAGIFWGPSTTPADSDAAEYQHQLRMARFHPMYPSQSAQRSPTFPSAPFAPAQPQMEPETPGIAQWDCPTPLCDVLRTPKVPAGGPSKGEPPTIRVPTSACPTDACDRTFAQVQNPAMAEEATHYAIYDSTRHGGLQQPCESRRAKEAEPAVEPVGSPKREISRRITEKKEDPRENRQKGSVHPHKGKGGKVVMVKDRPAADKGWETIEEEDASIPYPQQPPQMSPTQPLAQPEQMEELAGPAFSATATPAPTPTVTGSPGAPQCLQPPPWPVPPQPAVAMSPALMEASPTPVAEMIEPSQMTSQEIKQQVEAIDRAVAGQGCSTSASPSGISAADYQTTEIFAHPVYDPKWNPSAQRSPEVTERTRQFATRMLNKIWREGAVERRSFAIRQARVWHDASPQEWGRPLNRMCEELFVARQRLMAMGDQCHPPDAHNINEEVIVAFARQVAEHIRQDRPPVVPFHDPAPPGMEEAILAGAAATETCTGGVSASSGSSESACCSTCEDANGFAFLGFAGQRLEGSIPGELIGSKKSSTVVEMAGMIWATLHAARFPADVHVTIEVDNKTALKLTVGEYSGFEFQRKAPSGQMEHQDQKCGEKKVKARVSFTVATFSVLTLKDEEEGYCKKKRRKVAEDFLVLSSGLEKGSLGCELHVNLQAVYARVGEVEHWIQPQQVRVLYSDPRALIVAVQAKFFDENAAALHAPRSKHKPEVRKAWWAHARQLMARWKPTILLADANARVGSVEDEGVGGCGLQQKEDDNGGDFRELLDLGGHVALNTVLLHDQGCTWVSHAGARHRLDYVTTSAARRQYAKKVWVDYAFDSQRLKDDHFPVVRRFEYQVVKKVKAHGAPRMGPRKLSDLEAKGAFARELNELPVCAWEVGAEEHSVAVTETMLNAAKRHFGQDPFTPFKPYVSRQVMGLVRLRRWGVKVIRGSRQGNWDIARIFAWSFGPRVADFVRAQCEWSLHASNLEEICSQVVATVLPVACLVDAIRFFLDQTRQVLRDCSMRDRISEVEDLAQETMSSRESGDASNEWQKAKRVIATGGFEEARYKGANLLPIYRDEQGQVLRGPQEWDEELLRHFSEIEGARRVRFQELEDIYDKTTRRSITLTNAVPKFHYAFLRQCLNVFIESLLTDSQTGGRRGRGTALSTHTMLAFLHQAQAEKFTAVLPLVDVVSAFYNMIRQFVVDLLTVSILAEPGDEPPLADTAYGDDANFPVVCRSNSDVLWVVRTVFSVIVTRMAQYGLVISFVAGKSQVMIQVNGKDKAWCKRLLSVELQGQIYIPSLQETVGMVATHKSLGTLLAADGSVGPEVVYRCGTARAITGAMSRLDAQESKDLRQRGLYQEKALIPAVRSATPLIPPQDPEMCDPVEPPSVVEDWIEYFQAQAPQDRPVWTLSLDVANAPVLGDLSVEGTIEHWLKLVREFSVVGLLGGPPCETWSAARFNSLANGRGPRPVRSRELPWGIECLTSKMGEFRTAALKEYPAELCKLLARCMWEGVEARTRVGPRYRYLVNVAAVVSAWRLTELLASGSVLLLQEDSSRELIYEWLTPWEHFVPVSSGLSDLVAKVQWLESHQAEARAIAERGYRHFVARVRRQDTYCYLWQALRAMAAAQEPTRPPKEPDMLRKQGWSEVKPASVAAVAPRHTTLSKLIKAGAGPAHKAQEL